MKVLLTLYGAERPTEFTPEETMRTMSAWAEFDEAAKAAGVLLACEGLADPGTATTIRVEGGRRAVTDGPFIETKEQLGGFIFLEVRDLDEALEWAARTPWNTEGCYTEIRPIMDYAAFEAMAAKEQAAS
jgi:hypothetical protein